MWPVSNPATDLHRALNNFSHLQSAQRDVNDAWKEALDVDDQDLPGALGHLLAQVPRVASLLMALGHEDAANLARDYESSWSKPFLARIPQSNGLVDEAALSILHLMSMLIAGAGVTQGKGMSGKERADLRQLLIDAREELLTDAELPASLRIALLDAIARILAALDRFQVGGEDAVREAVERLVFTVATMPDAEKKKPSKWKSKILPALAICVTVFSQGSNIQENAEAWGEMLHLPEVVQMIQERSEGPREIEGPKTPHLDASPATAEGDEDVHDAELVED